VSISQSGDVLLVGQLDLEKQNNNGPKKISYQTATRCLQEAYLSFLFSKARDLSFSTNLYISIDSGSDKGDRDRVAFKFGGFLNDEKFSFTAGLIEVLSHTGQKQAETIEERLKVIQNFQEKMGLKKTELFHFHLIVYDNTSSNVGRRNGLFAHLSRLRKSSWECLSKEEKEKHPFQVTISSFRRIPFRFNTLPII